MLHPRTDPGDTTVASLQSGRQWFARVAFVLDVKTISLPPADALFTLRADVSFIGIDLSAHVPVIEHCFQVLVIMDFGHISNPQANAYRDRMTAISLDQPFNRKPPPVPFGIRNTEVAEVFSFLPASVYKSSSPSSVFQSKACANYSGFGPASPWAFIHILQIAQIYSPTVGSSSH